MMMERVNNQDIRKAVEAVRQVAHTPKLDRCDVDDLDELLESVDQELSRAHPNGTTLTAYLNSLARSLRTFPAAHKACLQLDAAMRAAGLPITWNQ